MWVVLRTLILRRLSEAVFWYPGCSAVQASQTCTRSAYLNSHRASCNCQARASPYWMYVDRPIYLEFWAHARIQTDELFGCMIELLCPDKRLLASPHVLPLVSGCHSWFRAYSALEIPQISRQADTFAAVVVCWFSVQSVLFDWLPVTSRSQA